MGKTSYADQLLRACRNDERVNQAFHAILGGLVAQGAKHFVLGQPQDPKLFLQLHADNIDVITRVLHPQLTTAEVLHVCMTLQSQLIAQA